MTKSIKPNDEKRNILKISRTLLWGFLFILLVQTSFAIGYAPLGVYGTIQENGAPIVDATIRMKASVDGEVVAESNDVQTRQTGEFYSVLTIRDPETVDVQITIETENDVYVQLLEGASGWHDYTVVLDLTNENMVIPAPDTPNKRPTTLEFEEDYKRIEQGDIDEELIEKYDLEEVPYVPIEQNLDMGDAADAQEPELEEPSYIPAPGADKSQDVNFIVSSWQVIAVIVLIVFAGLLHFFYRK